MLTSLQCSAAQSPLFTKTLVAEAPASSWLTGSTQAPWALSPAFDAGAPPCSSNLPRFLWPLLHHSLLVFLPPIHMLILLGQFPFLRPPTGTQAGSPFWGLCSSVVRLPGRSLRPHQPPTPLGDTPKPHL